MDDAYESSPQDQQPPKKRARAQLSCTECRRRKIACTKDTPCGPCVKRNQADACHTESSKPSEPPLSGSEQRSIAGRLHALETVLFAAHPDLRHAFNRALSSEASSPTSMNATSPQAFPVLAHPTPPRATVAHAPVPPRLATDTEDAAAVLENLAFHATSSKNAKSSSVMTSAASKCNGLYPSIVNRESPGETDPVVTGLKACLVKGLPSNNDISALVNTYYNELAWNTRVVCRPQFEADCREFFQLRDAGHIEDIDPAWLALLFAIIALVIPSSIERGKFTVDQSAESSAGAAAAKYFRRSTHLFEMAEGHERPQFRGLQTLVIYILHIGTVDRDNTGQLPHLGWMVLACKHAQMMGLFDLGDDLNTMPPPDVAFPAAPSSLARQLACRAVWALLFYDSLHHDHRSALPPGFEASTPRPFNTSDEELGFNTNIIDHPLSTPTDSVFEVAKYTVTRINQQLALVPPDKLTVDEAIAMTKQLNAAVIEYGDSASSSLQLHCLAMRCAIHHTILRLHRPWLHKALDPAYKVSAELCFQSALDIITIVERLTTLLKGPTSRFWLLPIHTLSAVVVLSVTFLSLQTDHPTVNVIWQHIQSAQESLSVHVNSSNSAVRRTSGQASQTIHAITERQKRFTTQRTGNYENDASRFLQLVSEDLKAPTPVEPAVGGSSAPPFTSDLSLASFAAGNSGKQGPVFDTLPYLPLDPTWVLDDQPNNLDWLTTGLGHF